VRDRRDLLPVLLTGAHASVLVLAPTVATVACGLWWNANAVSHQHVHRRFFRRRWQDAAFSAWLSLLLGLPQRFWRRRHLAHHFPHKAARRRRARLDRGLCFETALVAAAWTALAWCAPGFAATVYLPGFVLGLTLCALHGRYEHAGGTTSCYGRLWNLLFLNDGYHVEHHAQPSSHVGDLPRQRRAGTRTSRWPPVLRFLDAHWLDRLEGLALHSALVRRVVLASHRDALRRVLGPRLAAGWAPRRVAIVGGGLFPRSAILVAELFPRATILLLDADAEHLTRAERFLPSAVERRCARFTPGERLDCDVAIVPLALRGDRARIYRQPPAPLCLVHDWAWRRGRSGAVVAWWLLKCINLVGAGTVPAPHPPLTVASPHL